jgi:predicted fused transcriptional regulator/phosphomethylpyrimidine kinase
VSLVPEVGMNIAMATPYAENLGDVAAIEGRIVKLPGRVKAVGHPSFGCSSHLAKYILEASRRDPTKRAAINLRFSDEILKALEARGLRASSYDRKEEPEEIKKIEGMTIPWGMRKAIERIGDVPDFVYHRGDVGKEPMIVVLGHKASGLAELVVQLSKEISP